MTSTRACSKKGTSTSQWRSCWRSTITAAIVTSTVPIRTTTIFDAAIILYNEWGRRGECSSPPSIGRIPSPSHSLHIPILECRLMERLRHSPKIILLRAICFRRSPNAWSTRHTTPIRIQMPRVCSIATVLRTRMKDRPSSPCRNDSRSSLDR